jgi:hypothetical protein
VGGAVLGALARRGEAVAAAERGVLRSTMADGCCNPRDGCIAIGGGAARVLREYSTMRGTIHHPSGPHGGRRAAQSLAAAHRTDDRWSRAGVAIGDRTGRILCGRRRRRRRCDPSRLSQVCLFKWAGRDAPAGARPAHRPGETVYPYLSHAADAAVLRRPCAAPHCVSAWGDVLQSVRHEQVHRHDRELDRQHLQAHLSVRPPASVSQLAAPCDPAY